MHRHILVPYDGSDQSADALAYALASFPDAGVDLLHVVEPYVGVPGEPADVGSQDARRVEAAETMLAHARDAHDDADRIGTATTVGRPVHEILAYTEANGVDQIVLGSRGRDGAARLLLGSVAETVVRRAPVPVTVVRCSHEQVETPGRVLVPFDGSKPARRALSYALDRFEAADVTALYVLHPASYAPAGPAGYATLGGESTNWEPQQDEHVAGILDSADEVAREAGREIETTGNVGNPADAVVEYVEANEVDHVVLGSTGRDGLSRLLLGSVAETVVRRSPVSVTVAK